MSAGTARHNPMPWDDVPECHTTPSRRAAGHCAQCDGQHRHHWIAWQPPKGHPLSYAPGLPVRCTTCGGRKCDWALCWERHHHCGPHTDLEGVVLGQIGDARL